MMTIHFKKLTLAIGLIASSCGALAQPILVKSQQHIEEYKLDNGFRVILAPNEKENKVYMNTIYFTGSLNDPQAKGGLAHLLEHLAFKGTQDVPNEEFQSRLNQHTLSNNAMTNYYSTQYINTLRPDRNVLKEMIYLESQRMDKLVLQEKFVPSEIDIVKREREVRLDQPFSVLTDQLLKAAYGDQALGRLPIGDLAELQSIDLNELEQFYRQWYAPNNAVMIISGKFNQADVLKHIDSHFSAIPARELPKQASVPLLDPKKIQPRHFEVEKGSHLIRVNTYLNQQNSNNPTVKTALALAPLLYTMQPSGLLYQNMVTPKTAMGVNASTWIDQDINLVFFGAVYSPTHDETKVATSLQQGIETPPKFDEKELQRIKNLVKNSQQSVFKSATALGSLLSDYVVSEQGNWSQYFVDQQTLQNLTVAQVNQQLAAFFVPEHRMTAQIKPTPEEQKQARTAPKTIKNEQKTTPIATENVKSVAEYTQDIENYLVSSKQALVKNEAKIQRGELKNGLQYAFFNTTTQDDKNYATIKVRLGTQESLFNQGAALELTSYLLLRGSKKYSLQQITDKSIELDGSASVNVSGNSLNISIAAKKENFAEYFQFIVDNVKQPSFSQTEFDLIQSQVLAKLDRPYTEPTVVAGFHLGQEIEQYQPGDLRYRFEPNLAKQQFTQVTREQVVDLYHKFFAMNYAQVAVTGEFDAKNMQKTLKRSFEKWNSQKNFQPLTSNYQAFAAKQKHVLAEQREFGSYQSVLFFPVGQDHPDVAALQVFRHILGDSQLSSRLAQELREKNALVYGFSSHVNFNVHENVGALNIAANYSADKAPQVTAAVKKVLKQFIEQGISSAELAEAKATLLKKRVTSLEDERRIHGTLIAQLDKKRDLLFREQRDQAIAQLTTEDVNQAIQRHIRLEHLVEVMADQYGQPQD